jgi:hypothetical protein
MRASRMNFHPQHLPYTQPTYSQQVLKENLFSGLLIRNCHHYRRQIHHKVTPKPRRRQRLRFHSIQEDQEFDFTGIDACSPITIETQTIKFQQCVRMVYEYNRLKGRPVNEDREIVLARDLYTRLNSCYHGANIVGTPIVGREHRIPYT